MMKNNRTLITMLLLIVCRTMVADDVLPLYQRYFQTEDMNVDYSRGTYMIILADANLESILTDENTGNFIHFKKTQGYNVKLIPFSSIGGTASYLRQYLQYYIENIDSLLEYVLLIGDINGAYEIPSFTIPSYNESDLDVTDYPYTYFDNNNSLNSSFMIGRWPIRTQDDLMKIKKRSIQYIKMDFVPDLTYLNHALLVAGNYSDGSTWPVTPVWTSKWLMGELEHFGYNAVDTAFFHLSNQQVNNPLISSAWNSGVGIVNYRGWGDANGWHKPYFHREDIDPGLNNGWFLPIVMSFVCNTGDFGNDLNGAGLDQCFGEVLITGGSINNPKGAAAMIGPSDLDTDTRFNNVMCAVMWDELLEERIPELGPALHAGKQALVKEFGDSEVNGTNIVNFYHHVYSVLGDPSLPVWLGMPGNMTTTINSEIPLTSSFISTIISDEESGEPLMDVVGALLYNGELIAKGLSNGEGKLDFAFEGVPDNSNLELYLNKAQFLQKQIMLVYDSDDGSTFSPHNYVIPSIVPNYVYSVITSDSNNSNSPTFNWVEINENGTNLNLEDDSVVHISIGFDFQYYGESFNQLTVSSNGWASFLQCLDQEVSDSACFSSAYFFNNSITHPLGPYGMLAPFFDDLDDNNNPDLLNVYSWTNETDSLIIEWDDIPNGQTDENCPLCEKETFQLILDNSNVSDSENGEIIFQYKEIHDIDDHGSTIGIESPDKNFGFEYLFNYRFSDPSFTLHDSLVIKLCIGENCSNCINDVGDLNGDSNFDVVDIVALANCVLAANCNDGENGCVSDLDGDGLWNIIDIVALVNCVLYENCI